MIKNCYPQRITQKKIDILKVKLLSIRLVEDAADGKCKCHIKIMGRWYYGKQKIYARKYDSGFSSHTENVTIKKDSILSKSKRRTIL